MRFGRRSRLGAAAATASLTLLLAAASGVTTAHAEDPQDTLALSTPDIAAGGTVTQTAHLHTVKKGQLSIFFGPAAGEREPAQGELHVTLTAAAGGTNAVCTHTTGIDATGGVDCDVKAPGDVTVTYTLKADTSAFAWHLMAYAEFWSDWPDTAASAESAFSVRSSHPVPDRHALFARDGKGRLYTYTGGTGPADPIGNVGLVGAGWQTYTALTPLSPVSIEPANGAVVGRDAAGVLWYYTAADAAAPLNWVDPFLPRTRVGSGWNIYGSLTGAGDVTGDGKFDLVARDRAGVLWLYQGTGTTSAPFAPRRRIGAGWNAYTLMTGTGDLTGDGHADLVARDTTGTLWLYQGTGKASAPFAARQRIGAGWNAYTLMTGTGDMTDDGHADLVARDGAGILWFYRGTGKASAPFAARARVGAGWNIYNAIV